MKDVVYCGQCGEANPASNKFCGKCGSPITILSPTAESELVESQPKLSVSALACPSCGKDDAVIKVSGIVSGQTTRESGSVRSFDSDWNVYTSYTSSTKRSHLAEALKPPDQYTFFEVVGPLVEGAGAIVLGILALIGACVSVIMFAYISNAGAWVLCPVSLTLLFGWVSWDHFFGKKDKSPEDTEKQKAWEHAMERWGRSYYCGRCDAVFVKGEKSYTTPDNLYVLLSRND